jgi:hypothetical protein
MMTLKVYVFGVAILALGAGCGGTVEGASQNSKNDAGKPPPADGGSPGVNHGEGGPKEKDSGVPQTDTGTPDAALNHGAPSTTYPAFTPFMPPIIDNGGSILASPQIVTITWTSDALESTWEAFDDAIGSSAYWTAANSQYGVGPAVSGATNHVELSIAEPTWADTDVANFVVTNASDIATSGWPAPNSNIVYTIYLPQSTSSTFTLSGLGLACGSEGIIGGYHDNVTIPGVGDVAYAVVTQCSGVPPTDTGGFGGSVTAFASHELNEASTDPYPSDVLAWEGVDDAKYFAWDDFQAGSGMEIGDMCEIYNDSFYVDPTLTYGVQKMWSNASAIAGHAPCVPAATGAYYNVTPLNQEAVTIDAANFGGSPNTPATGYYIPVGKSKTFAVGFYSDGPTSGPWTIKVRDAGDPYAEVGYFTAVGTSAVTASADVTSGQNGDIAYITVTVNSMDQTKSDLIFIESEMGGGGFGSPRHIMPILISSNGLQ